MAGRRKGFPGPTMERLLLPVVGLSLLAGCPAEREPTTAGPSVKQSPALAPAPRPRPDIAADAPAARPLVLRRISIRFGFERAVPVDDEERDEAHWGKVNASRSWSTQSQDRVWTRVKELVLGPRSPRTLAGYLARWRTIHGCAAREVKDLPPLERGGRALPQVTFGGTCEGGDAFLTRVLLVDDTAYELHADGSALQVKAPRLREALQELLSRIDWVE